MFEAQLMPPLQYFLEQQRESELGGEPEPETHGEAAAGQVGRILREQAPSRQTVSIARNTELAVMFVERLGRDGRRGRSDDALEGAEAEALPATDRPN